MDAKSSAGVPLSSPAAAQRCAKGAGLDSGAAAAAQSAMPSIALPATASTADLLSTNAAAPAAPQLPSVSNLHQLDGRDPRLVTRVDAASDASRIGTTGELNRIFSLKLVELLEKRLPDIGDGHLTFNSDFHKNKLI
jgi:hypothetical protein